MLIALDNKHLTHRLKSDRLSRIGPRGDRSARSECRINRCLPHHDAAAAISISDAGIFMFDSSYAELIADRGAHYTHQVRPRTRCPKWLQSQALRRSPITL